MKSMIVALSMVLGSLAMAQGAGAGAGATAPAETKQEAKAEAKMDKKTAKMECLKENPKLKGKELSHCVKGKTK